MRITLFTLLAISFMSGKSLAFASGPEWQWDKPGTSGFYDGSINLGDGGSNGSFSRYDTGLTPNISNDTVSTPPVLMVIAATDIKFDIVQSGTPVVKPICQAPETPRIFVTPVTVCNFGVGNPIAGINAWADNSGLNWIPRVAGWFQGYGWRTLDGTACGRVEVKYFCE
jgi:hypothetical protein